MTWTAGSQANMALLAVGFDPNAPVPTPPAAPTLTSATAGNGSVALSWTVPADGGSPLSGYEVWRATTAGGEAFHVAPVGLGTTYTDTTNVVNGTTYYYQVRALNAVGPGPLSNEHSATPTAPPVPTPPAAPTLTSATAGNGSVALSWTVPADGGSPLSGYEVWRATTAGGEAFHVAPVGLGTTYTDTTDVINGTTYYYQVRALNSVGPARVQRALGDPDRPAGAHPAGRPDPDQRHRRQRERGPQLDGTG